MKTEIEVKFLNVDFEQLRKKLTQEGAILEQPMRLMRRVIIEPPILADRRAFIRIRDEGDKVTLTYKQFDDHTAFSGVQEIEVTVSGFEETVDIFEKVGLTQKSFQESRRETWNLDSVEIVLDEWPWLNPYIEIEGSSEASVKEMATRLGFDWQNAVFGSVTAAYRVQYPDGDADKLVTIPSVSFNKPLPSIISGQKEMTS
jgi:adenylate cyclase class 2